MKNQKTFFEIFENLEAPKDNRGKIYPLTDILLLALYDMLVGFSNFTNMSYYLKKREVELSEGFGLSEGVPSQDVFSDVFRVIDIEKFIALFVEWTKNLALAKTGQRLTIDGKAVRAATKRQGTGTSLMSFPHSCAVVGYPSGRRKLMKKQMRYLRSRDCLIS